MNLEQSGRLLLPIPRDAGGMRLDCDEGGMVALLFDGAGGVVFGGTTDCGEPGVVASLG